jgi:hypothetical protein
LGKNGFDLALQKKKVKEFKKLFDAKKLEEQLQSIVQSRLIFE